jgi:chemotaxis response regulator CheB|tara:strand:- start:208 stop:378 length:171 start_codon:yes stop_codon:yes gene_type:complete
MKNKLPVTVFIGQEMDEQSIRKELADCLSKEKELEIKEWKEGFQDTWPVQRVYPLE